MKLSVRQALALREVVPSLDGCERVIGKGDAERVVREPYRFEKGETYLAIAILKNRLDTFAETIDKQRRELAKLHAPEDAPSDYGPEKHPVEFAAFIEAWGKLLEAEHEIDLPTIRFSELGSAPIPAAAILAPLMAAGVIVE